MGSARKIRRSFRNSGRSRQSRLRWACALLREDIRGQFPPPGICLSRPTAPRNAPTPRIGSLRDDPPDAARPAPCRAQGCCLQQTLPVTGRWWLVWKAGGPPTHRPARSQAPRAASPERLPRARPSHNRQLCAQEGGQGHPHLRSPGGASPPRPWPPAGSGGLEQAVGTHCREKMGLSSCRQGCQPQTGSGRRSPPAHDVPRSREQGRPTARPGLKIS